MTTSASNEETPLSPESDNWSSYQKLVLGDLKRISRETQDLTELVTSVRLEIVRLRTGATYLGAIAGFLASLVPVVISHFIDH